MGLGQKIFTLGAMAAGAVVGVLFAPKKGVQIRKDLAKEWDKGGSGAETLKSAATKMGEEIAQTSKDVYESDAISKGKDTVTSTAKETFEKAKGHAKDMHSKAMNHINGECKCKGEETKGE